MEKVAKVASEFLGDITKETAPIAKNLKRNLFYKGPKKITRGFEEAAEELVEKGAKDISFTGENLKQSRKKLAEQEDHKALLKHKQKLEDALDHSSNLDELIKNNERLENFIKDNGLEEPVIKKENVKSKKGNTEDNSKIPNEKGSPKVENTMPDVNEADKVNSEMSKKIDGFMQNAIPMAVGGGLIFSMFDRKGQMSNKELYGQASPYGY